MRGVYQYARGTGWHVLVIDRERQLSSLGKLVRFWKPIGCIAEGVIAAPSLIRRALGCLPLVFCDVSPTVHDDAKWHGRACFVKHDSVATTKLAMRELLNSQMRNVAFVGAMSRLYWSDERLRAFRAELFRAGRTGHAFTCEGNGPFADILVFQKKLKSWLMDLPKPCGILAANDLMGELVVLACRELGLDIPNQVMLIGIDNEELRCEHVEPTLSSVEPDFAGAGYAAACLLDELIKGTAKTGEYRYFGPSRIVRRQSSTMLKKWNTTVQRALEKIRLEACGGLGAASVLASMGGSRSRAERLFRQVTGCSVYEKIEERRLEEVVRMLEQEDVKISAIADFCGYKSKSFLRKRFHEKFGMSMSDWRNRGGGNSVKKAER